MGVCGFALCSSLLAGGLVGADAAALPRLAAWLMWPSTITQVQRDLDNADPAVRQAAAAQLFELPPSSARRLLPLALDDSDPEVRLSAAVLARQLRFAAGPRVIAWLRDSDVRLRQAAAELLTSVPDSRALPDLVRALGDGEAAVRKAVVGALAASGDTEATLPLLGRIDDVDAEVRAEVLEALIVLGDVRATLPLVGKLQDPRPSMRSGVARTLGQLRDTRAVPALTLALADSEQEVKVAVLDALGSIAGPAAVPAIAPLTATLNSEALTLAALRALARIDAPQAAEALALAATNEDDELSRFAISVMPRAKAPVQVPLAACLAGQPGERVANACVLALTALRHEQSGALVLQALQRRLATPVVALSALAELRHTAALPSALEFLAAADPETRLSAARLCVVLLDPKQPDGRAVDPLARALTLASEQPELQQNLLRALGRTGSERAAGYVSPFLVVSGDEQRKRAAIDAAGDIGGELLGKLVVPLLDEHDGPLRLHAALALRRMAVAASFDSLWQRLTEAAGQDRNAVAIALAGPARHLQDELQAKRLFAWLQRARGEQQDLLLEAAGSIPGELGTRLLVEFAQRSADAAAQAKLAEVLAGHAGARDLLLRWAVQGSAEVRANAVWSLGSLAFAESSARVLRQAMNDADHAVAANAVAALVRSRSTDGSLQPLLCDALSDGRSYVRVNALVGLRQIGARCDGARERGLLMGAPQAVVREAAAALLLQVPGPDPQTDQRALRRCWLQEPDPAVTRRCGGESEAASATRAADELVVLVVPHDQSEPVSRAPFTLQRGDGLLRCGLADRRGAVFEPRPPAGAVQLRVPAQWVSVE